MNNEKTGFNSATGSKQYFSKKQDGVAVFDVVNLNVRTMLLAQCQFLCNRES